MENNTRDSWRNIGNAINNYGNLYNEIELSPDCSQEEIKEKYNELIKKFLPSGLYTDESTLSFLLKIAHIYSILGNPIFRKQYDDILKSNQELAQTLIKEYTKVKK